MSSSTRFAAPMPMPSIQWSSATSCTSPDWTPDSVCHSGFPVSSAYVVSSAGP
jgi:hypothetical protein